MNYTPYYNSWTLGYLKAAFPQLGLKDYYMGVLRTSYPKLSSSIVIIDDEVFEDFNRLDVIEEFVDKDKDILLIKVKDYHDFLTNLGYTCIYAPFLDVYDDCIALNKIGSNIKINDDTSLNYFCLNRNSTRARSYLCDMLEYNELIHHGYVTWHDANSLLQKNIPGLRDDADLSHYTRRTAGFERNNHTIDGIACSTNVKNYFYIAENIPGMINIAVETSIQHFFPTEKSLMWAFTKRLPIILAEPGRMGLLEQQGFDIFRDIIDHSYDSIEKWKQRINAAIDTNMNVLRNGAKGNFTSRLEKNYQHATGSWIKKELDDLTKNIATLLK